MDPTLAAILTELYRLSAENDVLKRRIAALEEEAEKAKPADVKKPTPGSA